MPLRLRSGSALLALLHHSIFIAHQSDHGLRRSNQSGIARWDRDSFLHCDREPERGINLANVPKSTCPERRYARYKDTDIYLLELDDPLSAVDSHVSRHLVDKCVCSYPNLR
ncbi:putative protein lethal [Temnothorax longispinosus]|uniref:Uncharacterized protein n=1 Tax=Temnothorax longispinosus TaxID=300112 RepID=A0A4S2KWP7_9HYME|nr:putative protein lethal [Temnothorax longispinosus]